MNLIYFVLCSFGLTQILVYGKIFDKIRPTNGWAGDLLSCPMCTGFWVGVILWAVNDTTELFSFDSSVATAVFLGCISSGTSYILNVLFGDEGLRLEHSGLPKRTKTNFRRWK